MSKRLIFFGLLLIATIAGAFYAFPVSFSGNMAAAVGSIPFGGKIVSIIPCTNGAILVKQKPVAGPPLLMWTPATKSYRYGPPPRPGQYILGMAGGAYVCFVGIIPVGAGPLILFYGSSQ